MIYLQPCAKRRSIRYVEKVPFSSLFCRFRSANYHKNHCRAYPLREELHSLYFDTQTSIPAACREGSVPSSLLIPYLRPRCRFLSANYHKNRCRASPLRQELQSLSDTDTFRLCRSRRVTPAAGSACLRDSSPVVVDSSTL